KEGVNWILYTGENSSQEITKKKKEINSFIDKVKAEKSKINSYFIETSPVLGEAIKNIQHLIKLFTSTINQLEKTSKDIIINLQSAEGKELSLVGNYKFHIRPLYKKEELISLKNGEIIFGAKLKELKNLNENLVDNKDNKIKKINEKYKEKFEQLQLELSSFSEEKIPD